MAEKTELKGSPALLKKLADLHDLFEEAFIWFHKEEHLFGSYGLDLSKAEKCFDNYVDDARDSRRELIDRLVQLGGRLEGMIDDPMDAFKKTLDRLIKLRELCQSAYSATKDDYVTEEILMCIQKCLEKRISKLEAKLEWAKKIGDNLFWDNLR